MALKRAPTRRRSRKKGTITPQVRQGMEKVENLMLQGWGFASACRQLGFKKTRVMTWRRTHKDFDNTIRQILASPKHRRRIKTEFPQKIEEATPESKKQAFIVCYAKYRDRAQALAKTGLDATDVEAWLDPEHERYDAAFARDMAEEEKRILWQIEDATIRRGLERDGPTQRFILQARMKERYGAPKGPAGSNLNFFFTADKEQVARRVIREVFRAPASSGPESRRLREAGGEAGAD